MPDTLLILIAQIVVMLLKWAYDHHSKREVKQELKVSNQEIKQELKENTEISRRAFTEANNFNIKFQMVQQFYNELLAMKQQNTPAEKPTDPPAVHIHMDEKPKA